MRNLALIIGFIISVATSNVIFGQDTDQIKHKKILQLLELSGSAKIGEQFSTYFINSIKTRQPDIDQKFYDEIVNEFNGNEIVKLIIPIYEKHYTEEEIDQLILFYQSPIGKKMVEKMPLVIQESMEIGQKWGMEIGRKIIEKFQKIKEDK